MQCLEYARIKYCELTGKSSPSSGMEVYPWWQTAKTTAGTTTTTSVKEKSIACWRDTSSSNSGHALFVDTYVPANGKYICYEANWDNNGNTRTITKSESELKNMYPSKIWLGCAYN